MLENEGFPQIMINVASQRLTLDSYAQVSSSVLNSLDQRVAVTSRGVNSIFGVRTKRRFWFNHINII